jgi:hypothetical protein
MAEDIRTTARQRVQVHIGYSPVIAVLRFKRISKTSLVPFISVRQYLADSYAATIGSIQDEIAAQDAMLYRLMQYLAQALFGRLRKVPLQGFYARGNEYLTHFFTFLPHLLFGSSQHLGRLTPFLKRSRGFDAACCQ